MPPFSKTSYKGPAIFFGFIFAVWFVVWGGEVLGPVFDDMAECGQLRSFLAQCAPDELRMRFYQNSSRLDSLHFPVHVYIDVMVDLQTGDTQHEGGSYRLRRGLFWQPKIESVFSTVSFPLVPPNFKLTEEGIRDMNACMASIPSDDLSSLMFDSSQNGCYLSFHSGKDLCIAQFSPGDSPPQLQKICADIGLPQAYDYWRSN